MSFLYAFNDKLFQKYGVTVKDKIELTFSLLTATFRDLTEAKERGRFSNQDYEEALDELKQLWDKIVKLQAYYDPVVESYSLLSYEFTIAVMELRKEVLRFRAHYQLDDMSAIGVVMAYE